MRARRLKAVVVLIFTFQSLRVLFSTLFGFIYDQVFEGPVTAWLGVSTGLALAALLAPALLGRRPTAWRAKAYLLAAILARPLLSAPEAQLKFYGAVLGAAAGLSFLALEFARERAPWRAVLWALLGEQTLRMLGDTFDLSLQPGSLVWMAALALALALWTAFSQEQSREQAVEGAGLAGPAGLALGGYLFLQLSLLSLPSAIARWSGTPYAPVALLTLLATAVPLFLPARTLQLSPRTYLALGILLGAALPAGYFLEGALAAGGLLLAQLAAGVGFSWLCRARVGRTASPGLPLAAGMAFFLALNFLNAFAFTYPYTLPFMRGLGWLVYLAAGITFAGLGWLRMRQGSVVPDPAVISRAGLAVLVALLLAGLWSVRPLAVAPLPAGDTLRFATWNIHYGYDDVWHTTLPAQVQAIQEAGVDVLALQEVDTGRMTSYSVDNAYYLARRLGMRAAYLPAVEHLTGIAVLYKGEPAQVETLLVPSLQEQTGIIRVRLQAPGGEIQAHGTWLGLSNEDTQAQIRSALDFIGGATRATFAGDFNSQDGEPEVEAVLASGFADPFTLLGYDPVPPTDPAIEPEKRIDYVFVRDLVPTRAWVADSLASDHRMVVVELAFP